MDLETLIPFIIVAAAYLFKAFENARKKERGKSRPAAPEAPSRPVTSKTRERQATRGQLPQPERPVSRGKLPQPERPVSGGSEPVPGTDVQHRPADTEESAASRPPMLWELPEEVLRSREDRQRRMQNREVPLQVLTETDEAQEEVEFDLREAVIQSAILERKEL